MSAKCLLGLILLYLGATPVTACDLKVTDAWIREAPPGLMTLAGYASLTNTGQQPLRVLKIQSPVFSEVQMHETVMEHGMASMRPMGELQLGAHQKIVFEPAGRHFMLMGANKPLHHGDTVQVQFTDQKGCITDVVFTVRVTR